MFSSTRLNVILLQVHNYNKKTIGDWSENTFNYILQLLFNIVIFLSLYMQAGSKVIFPLYDALVANPFNEASKNFRHNFFKACARGCSDYWIMRSLKWGLENEIFK